MRRDWPGEEKARYCRKKSNLCKGRGSWAWIVLVRMEQRVNVKIYESRRYLPQ